MSEKQTTLKEAVSISGTGLHTGANVTITFHPAEENHGYKFRRVDLPDSPIISALAENVTFTERGTVLKKGDAIISTIEHSLAALRALGVDNCLIDIDGPEVPILDGSAKEFVAAIEETGIEEQKEDRAYFVVKEKMVFEDPSKGVRILALPDDNFSVNCQVSFNNSMLLANQYASMETFDEFKSEISECRTFVFLHELEMLLQSNLIKGGALNNAIVIIDKEVTQDELDSLADLFQQPRIEVQPIGILNNLELKFPNEPARHKLLDIIGDLSLAGLPIKGRIIATRPGHMANVEFAKLLRKEIKKRALVAEVPTYNPDKEPVFDNVAIKKILPHRFPFLMVDKIIEMGDKHIVGIKNITTNEPFFQGHFPDEPIMPGVLLVEAMAQVGGILVLGRLEDPETYSTYFLKQDNVKFRKKVIPGDTVIFKLEMVSDIRRGVANMKGTAFVGSQVAAECEFMAQIVKNKD